MKVLNYLTTFLKTQIFDHFSVDFLVVLGVIFGRLLVDLGVVFVEVLVDFLVVLGVVLGVVFGRLGGRPGVDRGSILVDRGSVLEHFFGVGGRPPMGRGAKRLKSRGGPGGGAPPGKYTQTPDQPPWAAS